jgi:hypothetical protein
MAGNVCGPGIRSGGSSASHMRPDFARACRADPAAKRHLPRKPCGCVLVSLRSTALPALGAAPCCLLSWATSCASICASSQPSATGSPMRMRMQPPARARERDRRLRRGCQDQSSLHQGPSRERVQCTPGSCERWLVRCPFVRCSVRPVGEPIGGLWRGSLVTQCDSTGAADMCSGSFTAVISCGRA